MAISGPEGGGGWAAIARKEAVVEPKVDIASLLTTAGLKTVVVDANALIGGAMKLNGVADQFFTVREVLEEVRDPASRMHVASPLVTIRCLEPSDEALVAVTKFSRATGDFQSLSNVDLKLIALAYTLEAEVHGTAHIRRQPPPLLVTPSSIHHQRDPPGWGTVENAAEWEGIEEVDLSVAASTKSRILGLTQLCISQPNSSEESPPNAAPKVGKEEKGIDAAKNVREGLGPLESAEDSASYAPPDGNQHSAVNRGHPTENEESSGVFEPKNINESESKFQVKQLPSLDRKLNVMEGVDATKGETGDNGNDWQRASCRTTRRNYLKREAKRSARREAVQSGTAEIPYSVRDQVAGSLPVLRGVDQENVRLSEDCPAIGSINSSIVDDCASEGESTSSVQTDWVEIEGSLTEGPLWKSSVACMTADYAMQNVLLQMGLRLLSTKGMHIRELNKWVLKCQACNHVMVDAGRIFCVKCGNGGTLFKVSVTVGENGTVHAGQTRSINLRGTRYSLPMPKGGREGAALNPILREDQLPNNLLQPRAKKGMDLYNFNSTDVNFPICQDVKAQKLASVKTAAAIFGGRRNPNERHSKRKH